MNISSNQRKAFAKRALVASCAYAALSAGAAQAQEGQSEAGPVAQVSDIVVTGSRIARPDYVSNSPIVSVSAEAIENTGQVTVEKALSQMPQFSGSFGQGNTGSTSTGLNGGQSYASLRGLGSKRTLLLLDGRRLQPSNPDGSVDLNIIPEALIGNVEVITGGASTAYGSDATAGVVNFRLKRDFTGVTVSSMYGISDYDDGASFRFTVTAGDSFADNRGRGVISLDYTHRDAASQSKRPYYPERDLTSSLATIPQGAALFGSNRPTLAAVNNLFVGVYGTQPVVGSGGFYNGQIGFNTQGGTLFTTVSTNPVLNFRDPQTNEAFINGAGTQVNFGWDGGDVQSNVERYSMFSRVDYDISENIDFFAQATMTSFESNQVTNPTLASNVYGLTMPVTNPYISADFAGLLASRPNPNADFQFYKAFNMVGPRYQRYSYDVYQLITGLAGTVPYKDWTWEGYFSVSRAKFENAQRGGVSRSAVERLLYAADGGASLCDGGFNPFGNQIPSNNCLNYIMRRTLNHNELKQRMAEITLQGGLFELPAGEVRFAVGADYRYNSFSFTPDSQLDMPGGYSDVLGYSVLRATGGSVDTTEVYAELLIPVLKDLPMIKEFNLDLGYRYSDYSSVGGVHAYKADIDWRVVDNVRLRGGWNRAVRAPSVGELYAPISTGSVAIGSPSASNTNGDPCDIRSSFRQGPDGAKVRQLCLEQGVPASLIDSYQLGTAQVFALTGGNPDLYEETADTYSFGTVLNSPFLNPWVSDVTLSLDWYQIKVEDAVGTLGVANSIRYCFNNGNNNPTFDVGNYYCQLMERNTQTGVPINPRQPLLNLGEFNVTGVDFQGDWRVVLEDIGAPIKGRVSLGVALSYLKDFEIQALPGAPTYNYAGTWGTAIEANAGLAHPEWKSVTSLTYARDSWSAGLRWRHLSAMENSARVTSPTSTSRGVDAYDVFDLNARVDLPGEASLRFTVTNLFNKYPPQAGDTVGNYDSQNYDTLGRYYSVAINKRF